MTMASEIAQKLNVGTTQLKQIQSIARYDCAFRGIRPPKPEYPAPPV